MSGPPPVGGLLPGVLEDLDGGGTAERHHPKLLGVGEVYRVVGEIGVGVAQQRVAPRHQLAAVLVVGAQQAAQHPHGQLLGNVVNEVELVVGQRFVEHVANQFPDGGLEGLHRPAGEALVHQAPQSGVLRRVHLHHGPSGLGLLGVHLLQANTQRRRERLNVAAHR